MGQCAPEDSISQCPFLQMIDTAGNPHADGSAAPGARPRHRPSRHRDPPATSRAHDNWMAARQTSCRQQTAPPPPRCSKDVTAHPHRPGARPGRPCQVPARSGQPLSGRSGFFILIAHGSNSRVVYRPDDGCSACARVGTRDETNAGPRDQTGSRCLPWAGRQGRCFLRPGRVRGGGMLRK